MNMATNNSLDSRFINATHHTAHSVYSMKPGRTKKNMINQYTKFNIFFYILSLTFRKTIVLKYNSYFLAMSPLKVLKISKRLIEKRLRRQITVLIYNPSPT